MIRNEACSEKVDIYSFGNLILFFLFNPRKQNSLILIKQGVVLWELLTCEMPYENLDQNSIMWGVGRNKLQLTSKFNLKIIYYIY